jgi:hypothetical protein
MQEMKRINRPAFNVRTVFTDCISTVANSDLKDELTACTDAIEIAETAFEEKFNTNEIYTIPQNDIITGSIDTKQMTKVYDYRMVRSTMPGFPYYNAIRISAPYNKCPLCSVRNVDTLDHYLPKSKYPIYAVTPINLVPSCFSCNKGKLIDYPSSSEEQTLHPYFDDIENESWIKAKVLQTNPISFEYFVDCPPEWDPIKKARAINHFNSFEINELFTAHANEEYRGAKSLLIKLYNNHPNVLKAHLHDCYDSRLELGINSWQAVLYKCLHDDEWFCEGGLML